MSARTHGLLLAGASIALASMLALSPAAFGLETMRIAPAADPIDPAGLSWSVAPSATAEGPRPTFEYAVDPGTEIKDTFVITNEGTVAADFSVYATDAINDFETGSLGLLPRNEPPNDLGSWITTDVAELRLEPGSRATVPFTILIPSDASPGDHAAGVLASTLTSGDTDGSAVVLDQRVGARVNMRVSGPLAPAVEVSALTSSFAPSLNPFAAGDADVDYAVRNNGNIRLDVTQKLDIVGPFGISLGQVTPEPVENLLPGQAASVKADVSGVGALFLAWSTVRLVPGPVGSAAAPANDPDAVADPAAPVEETIDPNAAVEFAPASATTMSLAVSWTLLALIVILLVVIFFVTRYVRVTRERYWAAIDQAEMDARLQSEDGSARPMAEMTGR